MNTLFSPIVIRQLSLFILIGVAIFFIFTFRTYESDETLSISLVEVDVYSYETVDMQVFVFANGHQGYESANVTASFATADETKAVDILFHHVEDGLYEGEVQLTNTGKWKGEIRARAFSNEVTVDTIIDVKERR